MCEACQNEKVERCVHCFRCGSADHYARVCCVGPEQRNSGNQPGLPPRDRPWTSQNKYGHNRAMGVANGDYMDCLNTVLGINRFYIVLHAAKRNTGLHIMCCVKLYRNAARRNIVQGRT